MEVESSSSSEGGEMGEIWSQIDGADLSEQVMSEVHLGCPPGQSGPLISHFTISIPLGMRFDADGDLVLTRRNYVSTNSFCVTIQHNLMSSLPNVGLQMWRAELVLSDFVLHRMLTSSEFNGIVSLELGAGTGLAGILLARAAKTVFLTDRDDEILANCAKNVDLNSALFTHRAAVHVRELNWMNIWPPEIDLGNSASRKRYSWTATEIEEFHKVSLILAADVIYSDELTDALFNVLERLMSQGSEKVLYLALERRYNFSLDDLDVVANGYLKFQSYLRDEEDNTECRNLQGETLHCFVGKRMDIAQIPQYIREYDRGNDVEIWQIKYNNRKL